jgi:hypothetical protein
MPQAVETVIGYLSNAATVGAQALTPGVGQTFNVRATNGATVAHLEAVWGSMQDPGYLRVRSPRLHDDVNGIELEGNGTNVSPLACENFSQELYSQDALIFEAFFTAAPTAGHASFGAMQVYYDDLPGVSGNFMSWAQIAPQVQSYMGVYVNPTSNATPGNWGAGVALNSSQDVFKANGAYALLGYSTPTVFSAFSILGSDLGNLQVGGPGSIDPKITRFWFPYMETESGRPSIPVINSQNKASTLIQVASETASTAYPISLLFAYLGQFSGT